MTETSASDGVKKKRKKKEVTLLNQWHAKLVLRIMCCCCCFFYLSLAHERFSLGGLVPVSATPQRDTAEAEIKVPSVENPELSKHGA